MSEKLLAALASLDVNNDEHWTSDGLPVIDVVKGLTGESTTRADITDAAKGFSRKNPSLEPVPETKGEPQEGNLPWAQKGNGEIEQAVQKEPAPVVPVDESEEARLNELLVEANAELVAAQSKQREVVAALDAIVAKRESPVNAQNQSENVKLYQESQRLQREAQASRRQLMVQAVKAAKTKY